MSCVRDVLIHRIPVDLDPNQRHVLDSALLKAIRTAVRADRDRLAALVAGDAVSADEGSPRVGCGSQTGADDDTG